jgi:hypothetical protein
MSEVHTLGGRDQLATTRATTLVSAHADSMYVSGRAGRLSAEFMRIRPCLGSSSMPPGREFRATNPEATTLTPRRPEPMALPRC